MEQKIERLKFILGQFLDLQRTLQLLEWDQQCFMPSAGAEDRSDVVETISTLRHLKLTDPEVGKLLDELALDAAQLDPDSDTARLIKVTKWHYDKRVKLPAELVAETARAISVAFTAWVEARRDNNFAHFQPHLQKIIELRRRQAEYFAPYDHIYDPLLDDYEPGMKTAEVKAIFAALRPQQVALVKAIAEQPQVDDAFLHQPFDEQSQWDFGVEIATKFGYEWNRGRQDRAPHPFTTTFGLDDVRITTRFLPDYFSSAFFSTAHETGHALYELGFDRSYRRTLLADAASLAVHESQSRLWENLIGRSRLFWEGAYPRLQAHFPAQLGSVSLERFYKGINKVEPSLIRVEADEATYNLHIMLRLELEIALIEGSLAVKDLPDAWTARMQEYLGVTPPNDALGVLQDIHWSNGYFGYFSTYALGNLISVQLWERLQVDLPDLEEQIRRGEFADLLAWLREHIHRHGAKYEPQELVQRATGSKIDPAAYMRYLTRKYGEIYNL
jgi:carboxypeptidase Taq